MLYDCDNVYVKGDNTAVIYVPLFIPVPDITVPTCNDVFRISIVNVVPFIHPTIDPDDVVVIPLFPVICCPTATLEFATDRVSVVPVIEPVCMNGVGSYAGIVD